MRHSPPPAADSLSPVQASALTDIGTVTAGGDASLNVHYTAAVKSDGTVWAWGHNSNGQLGTGTLKSTEAPVPSLTLAPEFAILYMSWSVTDGVLNVGADIMNFSGADAGATVIIAVFDDSDRALDVKSFPATYSCTNVTPVNYTYACGDMDGKYFKVFVLGDLEDIRPVALPLSSK